MPFGVIVIVGVVGVGAGAGAGDGEGLLTGGVGDGEVDVPPEQATHVRIAIRKKARSGIAVIPGAQPVLPILVNSGATS
jgi:hypothetical protein